MSIIDQNSGEAINVWVGTQSEYDAITSKDENTLYFIKESGGIIVDPPVPEPEPEPQPEPEPEPVNPNEQYSNVSPRYDWFEQPDGTATVTWDGVIKYIGAVENSSVVGVDGATYTRGSLQSENATGNVFAVVQEPFDGQVYSYLMNVEEDPTDEYWRTNFAPAGYTFISNVGIRSSVPMTSMRFMFRNNTTFNEDISGWDVSTVSNMEGTFEGCSSFNQNINGWDVSNVSTFRRTFYQASNFNQPLGSWDTSSSEDFYQMLAYTSFNQDVSNWTVSGDLGGLFSNTPFNQDIGGWDVSNVTDMSRIFSSASDFNQNIGGWNVSNVTSMSTMFGNAHAFNQDISGWNVSNVTTMYHMFNRAYAFNQDISGWDVSNVTTMFQMFSGGADTELMTFNQDLSGWNLSFGAKSSIFQYNESAWTLPKPDIKVWEGYKITRDTIPSDWSLENGGDNANGLLYVSGLQNTLDKTEPNPSLTFKRGNLYSFQIDSGYTGLSNDTAEAHPLYLTTDDGSNYVSGSYFGEYISGVTIDENEFYRQYQNPPNSRATYSGDKLQFEVPLDAPDTLYYQCGVHGSMRGTIYIID